jgi:hypothetical protein
MVGDFFDPDAQNLKIENLCESAILAVDGHHNSFYLGYGDQIIFNRAPSLSIALS